MLHLVRLKPKIKILLYNKRTSATKMTTSIRHAHITIFPKNGQTTFSQDEIDKIYNNNIDTERITYYIVQGEYTKDKKQHLQIYAQFNKAMRYTGIKKAFDDNTIHIEPIKYGKVEDCIRYCTNEYRDKDGNAKDIFKEHKEYGKLKEQGKRSDLEACINKVKQGDNVNKLLLQDNQFAQLYCQYFRTFREIERLVKQEDIKNDILDEYNDTTWKQWQQDIIDMIQCKPDRRKIHWYYDADGNIGKSYLTKYLTLKHDAFMVNTGKKADILYSYNGEPVVIFDLPRDMEDKDYIYEIMEILKNGQYLSTKYESQQRVFKIPHIIVFSNYQPDKTKLSMDRWDIKDMTERTSATNIKYDETDIKQTSATKMDTDDSDEEIIVPKVKIPSFAFKCHLCDARFQKNYSLKQHIREHYIDTDDTDNKNNKEYNSDKKAAPTS